MTATLTWDGFVSWLLDTDEFEATHRPEDPEAVTLDYVDEMDPEHVAEAFVVAHDCRGVGVGPFVSSTAEGAERGAVTFVRD